MVNLMKADREIYEACEREKRRQQEGIELIASENFVSVAVLDALGSVLTNKYAEGYPGKRYYGGCIHIDEVEQMAIDRVKKLFGCNFANVQPHSGASANLAALYALLMPGDNVLGMDLSCGGHLTHGSKVTISGKWFNTIGYQITDSGEIDWDEVDRLASEHKPKLIIAGASAYPGKIDFKRFREIADKHGAYLMADIAHIAGLIVAGLHESSIEYAHVTTSTTHKTLRGPRGGIILTNDEEIAVKVDKAVFPGCQGGPLENVIAAKAVCFKEALEPSFKEYQAQVVKNAKEMEKCFAAKGIKMVTGGTDNHLLLLDLREEEITGKELEISLDEIGITVNKNSIKNDPRPMMVTSGIRIGTPAITTRGMKEAEAREIAEMIAEVVKANGGHDEGEMRERVRALTGRFPLY